jgi:nitrite reductase (NADH) large subunit
MKTTVVHNAPELMNRQLDETAAQWLRNELERRGLEFVVSASTAAILGEARVEAVQLADGRRLPADLVVMAVGVRPSIDLAAAAGLQCERGILVDDTLQTYDPSIYAVGECVQHRRAVYGLVAPLWEQARVCAAHLAELGVSRYRGSQFATQLKVTGIDVFSAGDFSGSATAESLVLIDQPSGVYKCLTLQDGCLSGAVLYGDTSDGPWYFDLIKSREQIGAMREDLLFGKSGLRA